MHGDTESLTRGRKLRYVSKAALGNPEPAARPRRRWTSRCWRRSRFALKCSSFRASLLRKVNEHARGTPTPTAAGTPNPEELYLNEAKKKGRLCVG